MAQQTIIQIMNKIPNISTTIPRRTITGCITQIGTIIGYHSAHYICILKKTIFYDIITYDKVNDIDITIEQYRILWSLKWENSTEF